MKNDSIFRNSELYYDPTAGEALLSLIREEKKRSEKTIKAKSVSSFARFVNEYTAEYERIHGKTETGKTRNQANKKTVRKNLHIYLYCIRNVDTLGFTVARAARLLDTSERIIRQCFEHQGELWKTASAYLKWKEGDEA